MKGEGYRGVRGFPVIRRTDLRAKPTGDCGTPRYTRAFVKRNTRQPPKGTK